MTGPDEDSVDLLTLKRSWKGYTPRGIVVTQDT